MKKWFAVTTFLALASRAIADDPADRMLAEYFAAMGGEARLRSIQTRIGTGSLETGNGRAGFTLWQKAPRQAILELRLPKGTMRRGMDGDVGWEHSSISGYRPMAPLVRSSFAEEHALESNSPDRIKSRFPQRERLSDRQLRMIRNDGAAETWTFDAVTHLVTQIDRTVDGGPQGFVPVTIVLEDYRDVDGIMLPHTIRTETKAARSVLRLETIRHGVPLADSFFSPPGQP